MHSLLALALTLTVTLVAFAASAPEAQACSIRGQYCGYPSWAANAFEGRKGYKGNPASLTDYYVGQPPRKVARRSK